MFVVTTIIISIIAILLIRYCVKKEPITYSKWGEANNEEWEVGLTFGFIFALIPLSNVIVLVIFGLYAIGYSNWYNQLIGKNSSQHWIEKFLFIKRK